VKLTSKQNEILTQLEDKTRVLLFGGSRCFDGSQKVATLYGSVKIKDIRPVYVFLTSNEVTGFDEYQIVNEVLVFKNDKRCIEIELNNGESIRCTEDHNIEVGNEWMTAKEIMNKHKG